MTTEARSSTTSPPASSAETDPFAEVERLLYTCETPGHLDRAEALLDNLGEHANDEETLARVYGQRVHVIVLRHRYAEPARRQALAEAGVVLTRQSLELDPDCLEANTWGAVAQDIHGVAMGPLTGMLYYLRSSRDLAQNAVRVDETYADAMAHQVLADRYRLSPPPPVGIRDRPAALRHLLRARQLAPECPQAKLRLAELYLSLRKPDLAAEQLDLVLGQPIDKYGPVFAEQCRSRARQLRTAAG